MTAAPEAIPVSPARHAGPVRPASTLTLHAGLLGDLQVPDGASRAAGLDVWLAEARECGIGAVKTIAAGLWR